MRCIIKRLALLAAALMLLTVPVLAVEGTMDKMLEQGQQGGKDECLLVAKNCGGEVDTIQQRIERIQKEIGRGTDVYTNDELKSLNRDLENEIKNLEQLNTGA
jgi:hypothetical protein